MARFICGRGESKREERRAPHLRSRVDEDEVSISSVCPHIEGGGGGNDSVAGVSGGVQWSGPGDR